ncbi:MAG: hypothetical protein ACK4MM_00030 [Fervidobacterium sp.]
MIILNFLSTDESPSNILTQKFSIGFAEQPGLVLDTKNRILLVLKYVHASFVYHFLAQKQI